MADDGWEDVTDPQEMKKVLGVQGMKSLVVSEGRAGMGTPEAKTQEAQFTATPQIRQTLRDLATAQVLNKRIPTGRFAARVNEAGQQFPSSWQPQNVADYQSFLGLRQGMAKPVIALSAPAGATTSSKEMDTPKELELALTSVPGPDKERQANEFLINRTGRAAMDKIAFNAFMDRWRSKYGSVYAKAGGKTANEVYREFTKSPAYKANAETPLTDIIERAPRRKTKPSSGWKIERAD